MPEQAARSSAGSRGQAARARDRDLRRQERDLRRQGDVRPAGDGNRTARGERNLRAVPDFSSGSEREGLEAPPRRTVVIRGQVADRYSSAGRSSRSLRSDRDYGPLRLRPDRAALWAVLLGLALVVVALASAHI